MSTVRRCILCGSKQGRKESEILQLRFYKFPCRNDYTRNKWVEIIKAWKPELEFPKVAFICSLHFKNEDFRPYLGEGHFKILKPAAVPSIENPVRIPVMVNNGRKYKKVKKRNWVTPEVISENLRALNRRPGVMMMLNKDEKSECRVSLTTESKIVNNLNAPQNDEMDMNIEFVDVKQNYSPKNSSLSDLNQNTCEEPGLENFNDIEVKDEITEETEEEKWQLLKSENEILKKQMNQLNMRLQRLEDRISTVECHCSMSKSQNRLCES